MSDGIFRAAGLSLETVREDTLQIVQDILNHAPYYHTNVLQYPADGIAARCFGAPPPQAKASRVFKRFLLVRDETAADKPVAAIDFYVGYPDYKLASVAMCVIREDMQRKGIGKRLLTEAVPAFLREYHPAVELLAISLTDNNVPALRFLVKNKFSRAGQWDKLDIKGRPVIALSYRRPVRMPED